MVFIYKRDDPEFANDTSIDFLKNWDIRVDWAEYWTFVREQFSHDDELAFSIHKEDFPKLIKAIKEKKPDLKLDERYCSWLVLWTWDRLSQKQQEVFTYLVAAFSEELWYRHIYDLCKEAWIETYDFRAYL